MDRTLERSTMRKVYLRLLPFAILSYVLAYIDGFWLCFWLAIAALIFVSLITRAPPGPFTPEPFGAAKAVMRKCGLAV